MMKIDLIHYLIVSIFIFGIAVSDIFIPKINIIHILMFVELIILSASINFVSFATYLNNISGQVFSLMSMALGAAETVVGLSILILYFKKNISIETDYNKTKS